MCQCNYGHCIVNMIIITLPLDKNKLILELSYNYYEA